MGKPQESFLYTAEQLTALEQTLSTERLTPYLKLSDGDKHYAIRLYEWNTSLSESFYGILQGLEIAIRNAMHKSLTAAFGGEDWFDKYKFEEDQYRTIEKAKTRIKRDGKTVTPGKLVAELNFGFWVSLTGPIYAQKLWDKHLHKCLARKLSRKAVHRRLDSIRKFRNRVAHHESILGRNLKDDFTVIVEAIHWICPVTAAWLKSTNSFHPRYLLIPEKAEATTAEPRQKKITEHEPINITGKPLTPNA